MIDLLLLGNGSMQPLPHRWLSSLLIRIGSDLMLFDCGEGTQIVYRTFGWGFRKLSTIVLSHHHADHIAGLPGILFSIANAGRTEPVHLYGPLDTQRIVQGLSVLTPHLPFELIVHELLDGAQVTFNNGLRAQVMAGSHRGVNQLGWRFDLARSGRFDRERAAKLGVPINRWSALQRGETVDVGNLQFSPTDVIGPPRPGLSFAVITDTRPLPGWADLARDVDLLVCEATYLDSADLAKAKAFDHMTLDESIDIAIASGTQRLILTHFSASIAEPLDYQQVATERLSTAEIGFSGWQTTLNFPEAAL